MALPTSGQIRMSQINGELGRSITSQISLDTAESGGYGTINASSPSRPNTNRPAAMSEWYGYDHDFLFAFLFVNPGRFTGTGRFTSFSVTVTSNVSWSVSTNAFWLGVNPSSGTDNGRFTVFVDGNTSGRTRFGYVTVSGGGRTRFIGVGQPNSGGGGVGIR